MFWHYPHCYIQGSTPNSAVRKGDFKLIQKYKDDSCVLYRVKDNIGESNNLLPINPQYALENLLHIEIVSKQDTPLPHFNSP
ncbi:hypothetical protein [Saccharicrinis sp. GN24d3]|uniref:hypothetical protein n=1 Tax=Saccharicrinis sp. GN24d3 TaxID=3458416 RepID=UPI0040368D0D